MRRLFYDIEVSPNIGLFWRTGYKINLSPENIVKERAIICIAWEWEDEDETHALWWDKRQDDKKMLKDFMPVLEQSDEAIAYFGDSFDMPWLRTRCLIHRIDFNPLIKTVDPLQWVKRKFNFNSNKLDYVAKILGVGAKLQTDYDLWRKVCIDKDVQSLKYMVEYNKHDVKVLKGVWQRMELSVLPKSHAGVVDGNAPWTCPRCGSEKVRSDGNKVSAAGTIQKRMQCKCGRYYQISETQFKKYQEAT
jgi:hypothetical protein